MKFVTKKPPIVTNKEYTVQRSFNLHIALIIAAFAAIILNGIYNIPAEQLYNVEHAFKVLSMVVLASLFSITIELFYSLSEGDTSKFKDYKGYVDPINTGILIALLLPITTPVFVLALSVFVGVYIAKLVFGGYGFYIFNPALVGVIFAFSAFGASQLGLDAQTPLEALKAAITTNSTFELNNLWELIIGNYQSIAVGTTSVLVSGLLFVFLAYTKVLDLRISGTYLLVLLAMSFGIGFILFGNDLSVTFAYVIVNLLTGLAVFAATFVVSETVSTPTSRETKLIYASIVAILTMLFRTLSDNAEGLIYAVLFGNMITPFLNRTVKRSDQKALIKTIVGIVIFVVVVTVVIGFILQGQLKEAYEATLASMNGGIL